MARTAAFEAHAERYDRWFIHNEAAYLSELAAVRGLLPPQGLGIEIGVGTGRFAGPCDIPLGLDPAVNMLHKARARGLLVVCGVAEALPFTAQAFDFALIVTTICFVDDPHAMIKEAYRTLRPQGHLVIGFIDRESSFGRYYLARRDESVFYRDAIFYSASEVESLLITAGFADLRWVQTLFKPPSRTTEIEVTRPGYGEGSFAVVRAARTGR